MLRYILIILSITILAGCSELQVIGNSAIREFKADGMRVDEISYNYHQKLAARDKSTGMMAKVETGAYARAGNAGDGKRVRMAKTNRGKGLWEKGSL